jgi:hypothetical protein
VFRSTAQSAERRAAYIDWTRGIAVLLMIEAHTLDAWTLPSSRGSTAFAYATMAAGFAAPLFLWLAGLAIPLAAASALRRGASRRAAAEHVCKRGLEIFILAFLFRLQAFTLTPGAHPITLFRVDILNIMFRVHAGTRRRVLRLCDRGRDDDAARQNNGIRFSAARLDAVVRPSCGRQHDVHRVSLDRIRVRRRCGRSSHREAP